MKKILYLFVFLFSLLLIKSSVKAWSEYTIGQEVEYNGIKFYVIKDSSSNEDSVTLLKKTPLTVAEVNQFGGVGTANNHVNMHATSDTSASYYQTAYDQNGYGGMQYFSSETCGYVNGNYVDTGCTTDYEQSEVKYVVDAWKNAQAPAASAARLIQYDEFANLGYEWGVYNVSNEGYIKGENTPSWVYNSNYIYWTMTPEDDSSYGVWGVGSDGSLGYSGVSDDNGVVRPVITISKSALGDKDESAIEEVNDKENNVEDNKTNNNNNNNTVDNTKSKNMTSTKVKVENTYLSQSLIVIILGFILSCVSLTLYYIIRKRKKE